MKGYKATNAPSPEKEEEMKKYMWLYKG
jgi:hypothetical protein